MKTVPNLSYQIYKHVDFIQLKLVLMLYKLFVPCTGIETVFLLMPIPVCLHKEISQTFALSTPHKKDTKLVEDGRKIFSGFVDHKHPVTWKIFAFQKRMYKEDL